MPSPALRQASQRWSFTLNNPEPSDLAQVQSLADQSVILCYGKEKAPTTGTPHLQGYVEFDKRKELSFLKKRLFRAHFEPSRLSFQWNIEYCSKDGDFWCSQKYIETAYKHSRSLEPPPLWKEHDKALFHARISAGEDAALGHDLEEAWKATWDYIEDFTQFCLVKSHDDIWQHVPYAYYLYRLSPSGYFYDDDESDDSTED